WTFEPGDVPEPVELPADRVEHANRPKSKLLVERQRRGIRQADAGDDRPDVFPPEGGKQRGVERRATPASDGVGMAVDAGLNGGVVGRFGTPPAAARVAHAGA